MLNDNNKINKNLYKANIDLVDKNRLLHQDITDLKRKIKKAINYIVDKSEEYKPGYRKVYLDFKECSELLEILESEFYE